MNTAGSPAREHDGSNALTRRALLRGAAAAAPLAPFVLGAPRLGAAAASDPLAPRAPHFAPRAKRLVFVFLPGGVSHMESFDPKPALTRDAGKDMGDGKTLLAPKWRFRRYGESGIEVSDLFPELGGVADKLCVVRSCVAQHGNHAQAVRSMHTGSSTVVRPSLGAWVSHALGTENPALPSFVVLAPKLPYAGEQCWGSDFLPACHQGVRVIPGPTPLPHLSSPIGSEQAARERDLLARLNERHLSRRGGEAVADDLAARHRSLALSLGLRREAPDVFDLSRESDETHALYGLERGATEGFAWQCLVARKLLERGVRTIELIDVGASKNWDAHGDMKSHGRLAKAIDRPLAGLLRDLARRGMLEDTLVVCTTEFGRSPHSDEKNPKGRGHHKQAFSTWLAGGGVRAGHVHGETDEYGYEVVRDAVGVHDLHATMLHLMGLDHERLTYRHSGRDFRLTDVHGDVVSDLLA